MPTRDLPGDRVILSPRPQYRNQGAPVLTIMAGRTGHSAGGAS
jgi:hypothetical protein